MRYPLATLFIVMMLAASAVRADDWPQWRGPQRDGVWRETGLVEKFSAPQLAIRWRVPIGSGYSGPTVADGRVYVTDRLIEPEQVERVHCLRADTGERIWSHEYPCPYSVSYPAGPRACVTVDQGRAFSLGAMGHLISFDAATGRVLWQHDLNSEYQINMPNWGITAAPLALIDRLVVQVGGRGACIVAFDIATGKELWRALSDRASYSAPILIEQGLRPVIACATGDSVVGLDPANGNVLWQIPFPPTRMPITVATPVVDRNRLFVTSFYDGSLMVGLSNSEPAAETLWQRRGRDERTTDALHAMIGTPIMEGDAIYGVDSYGELRCLEAATGDRVWESDRAVPRARWSTIHMVRNGERTWMFNERGELIIARLTPQGYEEISRARLIEPTLDQLRQRGGVCWAHPAFALKHVFARNDKEIVCASLAAKATQAASGD